MRPLHKSLGERSLHRLSDAVQRHPRPFVLLQALVVVLCLGYSNWRLEFRTNRSDLVGADLEYYREYLRFKAEFPAQEELVAIIESDQPAKNRQFVERLAARLQTERALFTNVFFKGDLRTLGPKALLFLPEEDLSRMRIALRDYAPLVQTLTAATNLPTLVEWVNRQFRLAAQEKSANLESLLKVAPALNRVFDQALDSLERPGVPPSPGVAALFQDHPDTDKGGYLTLAGGRFYLVTAHARDLEVKFDAVRRLRALVVQTQVEVPGINVGVTGEPVLEFDEMRQAKRDATLASVVALVLSALIFIVGYHETRRPLKATLCLLVGMGYTIGFATLAVGHLNILSVTFAPILIGLAIDFGVHLITRYEEELRNGRTNVVALRKGLVFTGAGIFTGAFATSAAFFTMAFTDFKGIREMGIISGGGLLVCLVPMMTLLPIWLLHGRQQIANPPPCAVNSRRERVEQFWLGRPLATVIVCLVLTALALTQVPRVRFDYNLLNLQTKGLASVEFAQKLMNVGSRSVLFAAVTAGSLEQAVALERKLTNLATVASVEWMGQHLIGDQESKLALVREIKRSVAPIRIAGLDRRPVILPQLSRALFSLQGYLGFAADAARTEGRNNVLTELQVLRQTITNLQWSLQTGDTNVAAVKLGSYQRALFADLRETVSLIQNQDDQEKLRAEDLPPSLRNRFVGRTGRHLLQVYPKENVWQRDHQEAFIRELRSVAPNVTETPVLLYEYAGLAQRSYREAVFYSLGLMAVLVWLHFRTVLCVVLALLPMAVGTVWLLGLMAVLDLPFNPANIMTLPLIIGIGATNGIHILNRYAEERQPRMLAKSTGKAVLVSALTTIAGFGSLMLAKHQGIASLGYIMSLGVAACVVSALTFLPCVINLLARHGWEIKRGGGTPNDELQSADSPDTRS